MHSSEAVKPLFSILFLKECVVLLGWVSFLTVKVICPLRRYSCHFCGTRHSVAPRVWTCGWLHIFAQCKQQTADVCVSFVCVCITLWVQTDKASDCAAHGFLASTPNWSLVWNVIYLLHPSPCALNTKLFIELPTTLHYLLTTSSTHCLVAELLMWRTQRILSTVTLSQCPLESPSSLFPAAPCCFV